MVAVGVCFLLKAFGYPDAYDWLAKGWPLILVVSGVVDILSGEMYGGLVWVIVGFVVGLITSDLVSYSGNKWQVIWPIVVILVGLRFLLRPKRRASPRRPAAARDGSSAIFGETVKQETSQNFTGTSVSAKFGGAKLDLREAKVAPEGAVINISVTFGGVEILAPAGAPVRSELRPFLGGFTDERAPETIDRSQPALILRGDVFFGGVEVKS